MLRWGCCAVLLVGGCYDPDFTHTECGPGGACPSGRTCNMTSGPPGFCDVGSCYGDATFTVCFAAPLIGTIDVSIPTTFDTGTGAGSGIQLACAKPMSGGTDYCVLAADTITIEARLRAKGTRPLVLVAATSIGVPNPGVIDVGSSRLPMEEIGAGADPVTGCNAGVLPTTAKSTGGGGAGGSFIGPGGDGGNGGNLPDGGIRGVHGAAPGSGTVLHGGCPGQDGAGASAGAGARGHGGGAVFLLARNSITVDGTITAGGEGGAGGTALSAGTESGGGGGGGAGGMIGFDARTIAVTGHLGANGGGGGEGGGDMNPGNSGSDSSSTTPAAGGGPGTIGGNGGSGSSGSTDQGMDGVNAGTGSGSQRGGGGGGGGGGAGLIKGPPGSLGPNVSPPATP